MEIHEIYTLVSEIHENVDLVLEIKNVFELEGVINSWDHCFNFLNRSILIFPKEYILLKVEAPFIEEISWFAIIEVIDKNTAQWYSNQNLCEIQVC